MTQTTPETLTTLVNAIHLALLRGGAELKLHVTGEQDPDSELYVLQVDGRPAFLDVRSFDDGTGDTEVAVIEEYEPVLSGVWNPGTPEDVSRFTVTLSHPTAARALGLGEVFRDNYGDVAGLRRNGRDYPFFSRQFPVYAAIGDLQAAARRYAETDSFRMYGPELMVSATLFIVGERRYTTDDLCALGASEVDRERAAETLTHAAQAAGIDPDAARQLLANLPPSVSAALCDERWLTQARANLQDDPATMVF